MEVFGCGVLIRGESGSGKSDLALALLDRGHGFVADDAVALCSTGTKLLARSPQVTQECLYLRGIGVVKLPGLYPNQILMQTEIKVMIELNPATNAVCNVEQALLSPPIFETLMSVALRRFELLGDGRRPLALLTELCVRSHEHAAD